MRIALIGWEIDDVVAGALAELGAQVVAVTRWFPNLEVREDCGGWTKLRCPHQIGGSREAEAWTFRDAVLREMSTAGLGPELDVVHALDLFSQPAAMGLQERSPSAALIGSVDRDDADAVPGVAPRFIADRWICAHPWVAERWRGRAAAGPRVEVIAREGTTGLSGEEGYHPTDESGPQLTIWIPRAASVDPEAIVDAVGLVREGTPTLSAAVLGEGPAGQALRSRLGALGWLARTRRGINESTLEYWQFWMTHATVVGVASERPADDPAAHIAFRAGVPVVRVGASDSRSLAGAIREAMHHPGRRERDVKAGAALAQAAIEPIAVARGWLGVYLDALLERGSAAPRSSFDELASLPIQTPRSRLSLTALSPRELYAAWWVRSGDWLTALEWLGEDAARATLGLRLLDVTDIRFHGANAHGFRDIEVGPDERHRVVGLDAPGRSFAGSLGVLSRRGFFQPIAHARLCHLPREGLAPSGAPERRIAVRTR